MVQLSQELIDLIVNEVDLDDAHASQTLSACCTVSSAFLPASRARLWSKAVEIHRDAGRLQGLNEIITSNPHLAPLVRTLTLTCDEGFDTETLHPFINVEHVRLREGMQFLPEEVEEYMSETWAPTLTGVTFLETTFCDLDDCLDFLHKFPGLKDIQFRGCEGPYTGLEELEGGAEGYDGPLATPESLYMDLTPIGVSIAQVVLDRACGFSLEAVRRLDLAFNMDEGDTEEPVAVTMHNLMAAIPRPLEELAFHDGDALFSPSGDGSSLDTLPIAAIPRVSFDVSERDETRIETLRWWTRSIQAAKDLDGWAIKHLQMNIIRDTHNQCNLLKPEGGVPADVWSALDGALADLNVCKLKLCIRSEYRCVADVWEDAAEFEQSLRALLPRSVQHPKFVFDDLS